ncbi:MAG: hypothetical protein JWQ56_2372 [Pseudarthrobacter sp.]|nr:hypothetical protein [Pseudarthrobacter sp.]
MTTQFPARVRAWLAETFYFETPERAAGAMADASRWGWLPALSGVAAGMEQAREKHRETAAQQAELSG